MVATFTAYVPAIRGGFIWDDNDYVTNNKTLTSLDGLRRIWFQLGAVPQYYPLVHTTFWLEYRLWGLNPLGFHVVNVLLHSLNAILLAVLLRRISVPGAWLAAAVFAVHPVHVESVAWITERKNVLSGTFYLGALMTYLKFVFPSETAGPKETPLKLHGPWRFYALAVGLYLCALFSKTVTATMPAAVLLIVWWKRGRIGLRDAVPLVPLFLAGAGLGQITTWIEKNWIGARGPDWELSPVERCLLAGRALWFYAGKLVWPHPLTFVYPRWTIDATSPWQYVFPLGALSVIAVLWACRSRIGRGPLTAVLFFAGTLTPALGFFNVFPMVFSYVADHFQYLASIGIIALFSACFQNLVLRLRRRRGPNAIVLPALPILAVLGSLTWKQGHTYKDLETLWRSNLAENPDSFLAHNNLGLILNDRGQTDEAEHHLREAIRCFPSFALGHSNLGGLLAKKGNLAEAIHHYREALRFNPNQVEALNNLALSLMKRDNPDEAIAYLSAAARIDPNNPDTHHHWGLALFKKAKYEEALDHYRRALRINPNDADVLCDMGACLSRQGRIEEAVTCFVSAIETQPDHAEAHYNLAISRAGEGKFDEAVSHYEASLRANPNHARAENNLGMVLLRQGKVDEAIARLEKAIRDESSWPEPHNNLAWLRATHDNPKFRNGDAALRHALRACELTRYEQPEFIDTLSAAYAELGRFDEAERWARHGINLARRLNLPKLIETFGDRLRRYSSSQPIRDAGL